MSNNIDLQVQLYRILGSTPLLLVTFGGAIWCMLNASRNGRTSLLVGIALGVQLASFFVMPVISSLLFSLWPANASDALGARIFVNSLVYSIPASISLGLLLWAAFSAPGRVSPENPVDGGSEQTQC